MNWRVLVEKVVVTFVEAALAFLALNDWKFTDKTVGAGAVGAGLSAAYNTYKQLRSTK